MKTKSRRGRVPGRIRDKDIRTKVARGASWDDLHDDAAYGEFPLELLWMVRERRALLKRAEELGVEYHRLGTRVRDALTKWLRLARGKTPEWPFRFTPDELHRGAKKDKARDKEVYRHFRKRDAFSSAQSQLDGKIDRWVGDLFRQAVNTEDTRHLRVLDTAAKLMSRDESLADPRRTLFLDIVGKDAEGKVCGQTPFSISDLARIVKCDRSTIRRWCKEDYGVHPSEGKRGPSKKR